MKKVLIVCFSLIVCLSIGQASNPKENLLPLALQSFSAICNGGKVDITWKAIAGTGDVCYTIEKSKDGKNFTKVIDVRSMSATVGYRDYAEADFKPFKGTSYYRLKQTDKNGVYKYSVPVIVASSFAMQKNIKTISNLVSNDTNLNNNKDAKNDSQEVVVVLRNMQGAEFVSKVLLMIEKNVVFIIDTAKSVPPGSYIITSSSDDKIFNYRLTVR